MASSLPRQKVGQLVTGLSDITSFSFWVLPSRDGPVDTTATVSIALWSGTSAGTPLKTVSVALPAYSASVGYTRVITTFNQLGLDPIATYVIFLETSGFPHYDVYTTVASDDGGLVEGTSNTWQSGYRKNVLFDATFHSIISVNAANNWAQGPGQTANQSPRWGCRVQSNYGTLQVNWQTLEVNLGYFDGITSDTVLWQSISNCGGIHAPYATAAACWDFQYNQWWSYAKIDLTGTQYKVDDNINYGGYLASGSVTYSNNNQVVDLAVSGDCGQASAPGADIVTGGFNLHLARL